MSLPRWLPLTAVVLLAALFARLNGRERVVVDAGIATFYGVPLTLVVFLSFLAGMLAMILLTLRQDLRVRRALEARGLPEEPAPRRGPAAAAAPAVLPPVPPFAGPVPEGESAALRVVPPAPVDADEAAGPEEVEWFVPSTDDPHPVPPSAGSPLPGARPDAPGAGPAPGGPPAESTAPGAGLDSGPLPPREGRDGT